MDDDQEKSYATPKLTQSIGDIDFRNTNLPLGGLNPHNKHFDIIVSQITNLIIQHTNINRNSRVLEIGCGTGRICKQLLKCINHKKYVGIDVNEKYIQYCDDSYKATFKHVDINNKEFNKDGKIEQSQFTIPYDDNSFDIIYSIAVFNHCDQPCVMKYIQEISRLLRHNGMLFGTIILLNSSSIASINKRDKHPFKFQLRTEQTWYEYKDRPLWNVAFKEQMIRRQLVQNKMMIIDPIRYGEWCGSKAAITGHDVIIASKGR